MADDTGMDPEALNDLGEPVAELRDYEEEVGAGFLGRVLRSLRRRKLGSQLATLGWTGMGQVLLEFIKLIHSLFTSGRSDRGERD